MNPPAPCRSETPDRVVEQSLRSCQDATTVDQLTAAWNKLLNQTDTDLALRHLRTLARTRLTEHPETVVARLADAPTGHPVTAKMAATVLQALTAGTTPRMDPVTELCTLTLLLSNYETVTSDDRTSGT